MRSIVPNPAQGALALLLACAAWGPALAKAQLDLRNLRANIEITPEDRSDITAVVDMAGAAGPPPTVTRQGDSLIIEGADNTQTPAFRVSFNLDRGMDVEAWRAKARTPRAANAPLPRLRVRTPMTVDIKSNAQVFAAIGPSRSVLIRDSGRGVWRLGKVDGAVEIHGWGSANVSVASADQARFDMLGLGNVDCGDVNALTVDSYGAGEVSIGRVAGRAEINISGVGGATIDSITGPLRVDMDDVGSVRVRGGEISTLVVRSLDGRGQVNVDAAVQDADINIGSETQVHLRRLTGILKKTTRQAATLDIGQPLDNNNNP